MRSLYESILAKSHAGKASVDERSAPHVSKRKSPGSLTKYFDVDLDLQTWFRVVSDENFNSVFDESIQELRRVRGKRYVDDVRRVGIFFSDGYLEVKLIQSPHNKYISYNWYFADEPRSHYTEIDVAYRFNWKALEDKAKNASGWNWLPPTYSRKDGIKDRLRKYMNAYIPFTPKQ